MDFFICIILIALAAFVSCAASLPIFKILQLSGYKASGIFSWWKASGYNTLIRYIGLTSFSFIAVIVYIGCFGTYAYARYCAVALYLILGAVFVFSTLKGKDGNVKYTPRMIRLILADLVLMLALSGAICLASYYSPYFQSLIAALAMLVPFVVIAANAIMLPFEKLNNKRYIKRAKAKLKAAAPVVIGITGSYGKTTAKNILAAMLAKKYSALCTPGSFNTPMGICKTINSELSDQDCFIAEMGARKKGDIAELCNIVSPKYGIITAIGDMHLESFGSRNNVADAKFELAKSLPADGALVLNGYNAPCAELNKRDTACHIETVGADGRVFYKDIAVSSAGTAFTLAADGGEYAVKTKLLGAHIPELVCVCAEVALALDVSPEDIVGGVNDMEPVEHRLCLVESADPAVTVIDDAYNSNPVGAKNALDVLGLFGGKKIIITPGFVELGVLEKPCNTELGRQIAAVCDRALLVGSRAADIKSGAIEAGMAEEKIGIFSTRDEAVEALKTSEGERVVLFENDLPDNIK